MFDLAQALISLKAANQRCGLQCEGTAQEGALGDTRFAANGIRRALATYSGETTSGGAPRHFRIRIEVLDPTSILLCIIIIAVMR
jgi:hypothetical protein